MGDTVACRHCRVVLQRCRCPRVHELTYSECAVCADLIARGLLDPKEKHEDR